jgi:hypothetical protein
MRSENPHKAGAGIEDTANDVFVRLSHANPIGEIQTTPELSVSPPLRTRAFSAIPRSSQVFMLVPPGEDSDSLWEEELVLSSWAGRAIQEAMAGAVPGRSFPRASHITGEDVLKRMVRSDFW